MRHRVRLGACTVCALLMAACGGGTRATDEAKGNVPPNGAANNPLLNSDTRPQPMTVTGCLTSSGDRFVLTALDNNSATATTETYELRGAQNAELAKYVNREVRVAGEADAPRVADVRELPSASVGTSGTASGNAPQGAEPTVKTQEATRFAVRHLTVSSVTPTGDNCTAPAASKSNR